VPGDNVGEVAAILVEVVGRRRRPDKRPGSGHESNSERDFAQRFVAASLGTDERPVLGACRHGEQHGRGNDAYGVHPLVLGCRLHGANGEPVSVRQDGAEAEGDTKGRRVPDSYLFVPVDAKVVRYRADGSGRDLYAPPFVAVVIILSL
jgi:hypothetical protein